MLLPIPPFLKISSLLENKASSQVSAISTQLQATAIQLQSENQRIKTEIYKTIHEITDSSICTEESPSTEWSWILSSYTEAQILWSNYDELWDRHMNSSCEITTGLYAEMARRHNNLWRLY